MLRIVQSDMIREVINKHKPGRRRKCWRKRFPLHIVLQQRPTDSPQKWPTGGSLRHWPSNWGTKRTQTKAEAETCKTIICIWLQNGESGIRMMNLESEWWIWSQTGEFGVQNGLRKGHMIESAASTTSPLTRNHWEVIRNSKRVVFYVCWLRHDQKKVGGSVCWFCGTVCGTYSSPCASWTCKIWKCRNLPEGPLSEEKCWDRR